MIGRVEAALELPSLIAFSDELELWAAVEAAQIEEAALTSDHLLGLGLNEYQTPTEYRLLARPPPARFVLPTLETRVWGIDLGQWPQVTENKRFSLGIA